MRVYPDQLQHNLKPLSPFYLLFGDDPWLIENSRNMIVQFCKKKGFQEILQINSQDSGFSWNTVWQEWQAMSLFASQRIIELQLPQGKPGTEGSNILQQMVNSPNPDTLLLMSGPKLGMDQTKSKWFKLLDEKGLYIPCATPEGNQFNRWLNNQIQHYQLNLNQNAKALLFNLYEGNLLAADQSLKLLQLLNPSKLITAEDLSHYFEDQSRFNVFQLSDALLDNKQAKVQHILAQLQSEGTAISVILWALFKELSVLLAMKTAIENKENINQLWQKHRIWDKRKSLYQNALNRLSLEQIEMMLTHASKIELQLKRKGNENWVGLSHLCLLFDPSAHRFFAHIEIE